MSPELDGKRQDLLIEAMPGARRIAAMVDSKVTPAHYLQGLFARGVGGGVGLDPWGVSPGESGWMVDLHELEPLDLPQRAAHPR